MAVLVGVGAWLGLGRLGRCCLSSGLFKFMRGHRARRTIRARSALTRALRPILLGCGHALCFPCFIRLCFCGQYPRGHGAVSSVAECVGVAQWLSERVCAPSALQFVSCPECRMAFPLRLTLGTPIRYLWSGPSELGLLDFVAVPMWDSPSGRADDPACCPERSSSVLPGLPRPGTDPWTAPAVERALGLCPTVSVAARKRWPCCWWWCRMAGDDVSSVPSESGCPCWVADPVARAVVHTSGRRCVELPVRTVVGGLVWALHVLDPRRPLNPYLRGSCGPWDLFQWPHRVLLLLDFLQTELLPLLGSSSGSCGGALPAVSSGLVVADLALSLLDRSCISVGATYDTELYAWHRLALAVAVAPLACVAASLDGVVSGGAAGEGVPEDAVEWETTVYGAGLRCILAGSPEAVVPGRSPPLLQPIGSDGAAASTGDVSADSGGPGSSIGPSFGDTLRVLSGAAGALQRGRAVGWGVSRMAGRAKPVLARCSSGRRGPAYRRLGDLPAMYQLSTGEPIFLDPACCAALVETELRSRQAGMLSHLTVDLQQVCGRVERVNARRARRARRVPAEGEWAVEPLWRGFQHLPLGTRLTFLELPLCPAPPSSSSQPADVSSDVPLGSLPPLVPSTASHAVGALLSTLAGMLRGVPGLPQPVGFGAARRAPRRDGRAATLTGSRGLDGCGVGQPRPSYASLLAPKPVALSAHVEDGSLLPDAWRLRVQLVARWARMALRSADVLLVPQGTLVGPPSPTRLAWPEPVCRPYVQALAARRKQRASTYRWAQAKAKAKARVKAKAADRARAEAGATLPGSAEGSSPGSLTIKVGLSARARPIGSAASTRGARTRAQVSLARAPADAPLSFAAALRAPCPEAVVHERVLAPQPKLRTQPESQPESAGRPRASDRWRAWSEQSDPRMGHPRHQAPGAEPRHGPGKVLVGLDDSQLEAGLATPRRRPAAAQTVAKRARGSRALARGQPKPLGSR